MALGNADDMMEYEERGSRSSCSISRLAEVLLLILVLAAASVMMTSCASSAAESAVRDDLESMRDYEPDEELADALDDILDDQAMSDFDIFMDKVRAFEYEIEGSEESGDNNDEVTVTVRITTYNFGREYLSTWSEYLDMTGGGEFDQTEFYELLMENLSSLELRSYDMNVDIVCSRDEDGEWHTDAGSNMALRDALLGGLMTEIAAVADL